MLDTNTPSAPEPTASRLDEAIVAHYPHLHRKALRLLGDREEARDLVHDTIERGLRRREQLRRPLNEAHWLSTILKNLMVDNWRQRRSRPAGLPFDEAEHTASPAEEGEPPLSRRFTLLQVRHAAARLPEPFRSTFELHHFEGVSYVELSRRHGIPLRTVGTRLLRARARLRALLLTAAEG